MAVVSLYLNVAQCPAGFTNILLAVIGGLWASEGGGRWAAGFPVGRSEFKLPAFF